MAGFLRMRRLLLVNALIFAVLAAAVALAYYGFSYTSRPDSEEALIREVAEEKVLNIEALIEQDDAKIFAEVQLDPLSNLGDIVKAARAAVLSVFVLDDQLQVVPGGYVSGRPKN